LRLTEIKLAGFKTFVDPTVIPMSGNLVGIVGPNGCGKSNIIDAVRWVLGESRASALRGESLQDVIFNGSVTRKPVGRASVELIFDNNAGRAAGQWKVYNEIAIRRVIQRNAESSYYINNIRVRRRDITDLFLGTGVSGRGYAIIEQGMISRIIEARPQELRAFLEEVAGISRYHEKRHETGLRLADTRNNMQRMDDVLQELDKQQQHLTIQAEHAARYQFLHKQLAATQHALWTQRKQQATELRNKAQQKIESLIQKIEVARANLQELAEKLIELRTHHQAVNDQQHRIREELYAAKGEITRIEQNIQHVRINKEQLNQQLTQAQLQLQNHKQQLDEANESLETWLTELAQARSDHVANQDEYEREVEKLPQIEAAMQADQMQLTELREKLLLIRQNEKLQQNQRAYIEKTLQQLTVRRERLAAQQSDQPEIDLAQLDKLRLESTEFTASLEKDQCLLGKYEIQMYGAQQRRDTLQQTIQLLQRDLAQANARLDVLRRLQDQIEDNQELNTWMAEKQLNVLPRLWQQISVESGWETALEAVLRERLQSVIIDHLEQLLDWEFFQ
jgi:chromosome segregation protein